MRIMLYMALLCITPLGGCAYLDAQADLVEQARKGVALAAAGQEQRAALIEQLSKLRRDRLDEGFDADVRGREALSADWVIEARRGYAAALEALGQWRSRQEEAERAAAENLAAVDAALQRVAWLQEAALGWMRGR